MPISDLTGTKWTLNTDCNDFLDLSGDIDFISNGQTFDQIYGEYDDDTIYYWNTTAGEGIHPYDYDTWQMPEYRIIEITGGTDATNASLIAWLQANATQVEVTNLNGTTWEVNSSVSIVSGYGAFDLVFGGEYSDLSGIAIGYNASSYRSGGDLVPGSSIFFLGDVAGEYQVAGATFSITGGTDATNPDLITWLAQNAVYQAPQPVTPSITVGNLSIEKEYLGNLPIEKMYFGNILLYEASSPSQYDYSLDGSVLTIDNAPYSQSGSELTIE